MEKVLLCSDFHVPFHSQRGVELLYQVAQQWKPDRIVVAGDLMDCYSISSHSKDPGRRYSLAEEVEVGKEVLDRLGELVHDDGRLMFLEGNHEERLERYIRDKAPELFGLVSMPQILGLREKGWQHTRYRKHIRIGKLFVTHDIGFAGRYAAQRTLDAMGHSVSFGHTHRLSLVVEGNALGEGRVALNLGWLGDLDQVDYMHRAKANKDWHLGFGLAYLDTTSGLVKLDAVPLLPLNGGKKMTCNVEGNRFVA